MKTISLLILLTFLLACTEKVEGPVPGINGLLYFPIEVGVFRDYSAREVIYFTPEDVQTREFQIREVIERKFTNQQGKESFEIFRYSRANSNAQWNLDSLWVVRSESNRIVQIENNIPFIKLVFPILEGRSWDGNGLNGRNTELYQYTELLQTYSTGPNNFSDCVYVQQQDDDDALTIRDIRFEVYCKEVGLVHRYIEVLRYCSRPACLGQKIIEQGRLLEMKLVQHGKL
jgi:hypothetical protein